MTPDLSQKIQELSWSMLYCRLLRSVIHFTELILICLHVRSVYCTACCRSLRASRFRHSQERPALAIVSFFMHAMALASSPNSLLGCSHPRSLILHSSQRQVQFFTLDCFWNPLPLSLPTLSPQFTACCIPTRLRSFSFIGFVNDAAD